jgi:hypothetical protein
MLPVDCELEVEDWFVRAVLDYTRSSDEYCFKTAFLFMHRRCFELGREIEFNSMRGKTLLLLAQATGDYSLLTLWCAEGLLRTPARDPDVARRGSVRVGQSGKTRRSERRAYKTAA